MGSSWAPGSWSPTPPPPPAPRSPDPLLSHPPPGAGHPTAGHFPSGRPQPPSQRGLLPAGDPPHSGLSSASSDPPTLHTKPPDCAPRDPQPGGLPPVTQTLPSTLTF